MLQNYGTALSREQMKKVMGGLDGGDASGCGTNCDGSCTGSCDDGTTPAGKCGINASSGKCNCSYICL